MDKKVFEMYEAPAIEVVELKLQGFLCESGTSQTPADGVEEED